ncbi:hypothetical protein TRAPUB_6924 [Trametes pubescens]|uniref:C2H2-type domain-containing protein n=1 Tax=Trametes pubescens TaxID=154538 RepID=A0A1M2V4X3_TRAPU|nr:hypothetical protein TRAPUB_6924 [Trametes pubescens]
MNSNTLNAAPASVFPLMALPNPGTSSLGRQMGTRMMATTASLLDSLDGLREDEGYVSASLSPAPEEHAGSAVGYVPEMSQPFQSEVEQTGAFNDKEYHLAGAVDASGDVPPFDGPCNWSEEDFVTLVNCLSASTDVLLTAQPLAMPSILDAPAPSSAASPQNNDHAAAVPQIGLASPGAGPSSIPQDALAMPAPPVDTPQQCSHKRSRSEETSEALPSTPIKKLRAQEGFGEIPDLQEAASWNAAGWVMPPGHYAPLAPGPFMMVPPGYYAAPLAPGQFAFWPYPQSIGTTNQIHNGVAPEQSRAHGDIPPTATVDQAAGAPVPDAPQNAKRPRRTNEDITPTLIAGIQSDTCGFAGCEVILDPRKGENNRKHVKAKHYTATELGSDAQLACNWSGCGRPIRGKQMMAHIERDHIGYAYQCLVPGCRHAWKGSRAKDWTTHMNREHRGK